MCIRDSRNVFLSSFSTSRSTPNFWRSETERQEEGNKTITSETETGRREQDTRQEGARLRREERNKTIISETETGREEKTRDRKRGTRQSSARLRDRKRGTRRESGRGEQDRKRGTRLEAGRGEQGNYQPD